MSNGFGAAGPAYGFNVLDGSPRGQAIHFTAVSFMYGAIALSKTAFAITLLRLTSGWRSKGLLWLVMVLTNVFNLAMFILTWLDICDTRFDLAHLPGRCIPMTVATWLHLGSTLNSLVCDIILTCYPWWIISQVAYIPKREKWGVAASMGLVGFAIPVEIAKIVIFSMIPSTHHGEVDYTCKFQNLILTFPWRGWLTFHRWGRGSMLLSPGRGCGVHHRPDNPCDPRHVPIRRRLSQIRCLEQGSVDQVKDAKACRVR